VDPRLEQVPGFGECGRCLYNTSGPAELCYACARRTIEPLADNRCAVCDRPFADDEITCRNPLCNRANRAFRCNYALAMRSGVLQRAINRYKYDGQYGWALVFGRVLIGFLEQEADLFRGFDVITASPTYVGPGGRTFDHTRTVLEKASVEAWPGEAWPFDLDGPPLIVKVAPTPAMVGHSYRERRDIAEGPLRNALRVTRPQDVARCRVLVYDDVFTDGLTLNEVARALRAVGAAEVCGISLCRQPFRG
jgi:predicted amidophosphoribosyltransferase